MHFRAEVQMMEIKNEEQAIKRTWNDSKKREKPMDRGQFGD